MQSQNQFSLQKMEMEIIEKNFAIIYRVKEKEINYCYSTIYSEQYLMVTDTYYMNKK
jgi:hypothetical protein